MILIPNVKKAPTWATYYVKDFYGVWHWCETEPQRELSDDLRCLWWYFDHTEPVKDFKISITYFLLTILTIGIYDDWPNSKRKINRTSKASNF